MCSILFQCELSFCELCRCCQHHKEKSKCIGLWEWFFNNVYCMHACIHGIHRHYQVLEQDYKFIKRVAPNSLCICVDMCYNQPVDSKSFSGLTKLMKSVLLLAYGFYIVDYQTPITAPDACLCNFVCWSCWSCSLNCYCQDPSWYSIILQLALLILCFMLWISGLCTVEDLFFVKNFINGVQIELLLFSYISTSLVNN